MTVSKDSFVKAERRGAVMLLAIDRPDARNALNPAILTKLAEELTAADQDPAIYAVVLTGGPKNF